MQIKSYAKINLTLDILKKAGTHHLIQTVFQQINLHDLLTFKKLPNSQKILLRCDNPAVPRGAKNTIIRAAQLLKDTYLKSGGKKSQLKLPHLCGVEITLKKNIPIASGLGGSSSNAAATLIALNKIWNLKLSPKKLQQLAAKIGMDVPFFLYTNRHAGGVATGNISPPINVAALGTHFGEKILPLPVLPKQYIVIAINNRKTGTGKNYQQIDKLTRQNPNLIGRGKNLTKKLITALKSPPRIAIAQLFHNDFDLICKPKTNNLKRILLRTGALGVHTSGSGPAIYALYKNRTQQINAFNKCNRLKNLSGSGIRFIWRSS